MNAQFQSRHDAADADHARARSRRGPTPSAELLQLVRSDLMQAFGDRVSRILLFGSRARGDHRPDSDWDVAVVLKDSRRGWPDAVAAGDVRMHVLAETGEMVDVVVVEESTLAALPHVQTALQDGIVL